MDAIIRYLTEVSQRLGAGTDPAIILGGAVAAFLFLVMILFALRTSGNRNLEAQRTSTVVTRLESLEGNMQKFRKEIEEMSSVYRDQTVELRDELSRLRRLVEGGGGGDGGSSDRGGGGAPPFGSGPGRRGSAKEDFSTQAWSSDVPAGNLSSGLAKTRRGFMDRVRGLFGSKDRLDPASLDSIEEILITSDLGVGPTSRIMDKLKADADRDGTISLQKLTDLAQEALLPLFTVAQPGSAMYQPARMDGTPLIVMVVGVNGAGKTTTVAKLAERWKRTGQKVLVVAADTFRAGAVDQLQVWAERVGVEFVSGEPEAKPSTVAYLGMAAAKEKGADVVIIDTAGRLHTKSNLMQELEGVRNSIRKHYTDAPHETILVVDGVSGQNALLQAREFNSAVELSGVIVTKLDGSAKGGVVAAISSELRLPIYYVGVGEGVNDLIAFDVRDFVSGLFQEKKLVAGKSEHTGSHV